ncbi:CIC11C00000004443 [Sungouiella intermedia]|uniref:CIC11C00000004443 n=1 Tax=Sungouiella intermedia TaxID=45354 RepID=A0A1L0D7A9_9ASCO|nr:CIC11C00000004443 [[Candida] intermedia]
MTNLLTELPYFPEISPITVTQFDINELFRDGIPTSKIASDGILAFHSVTFATSNAKEMARYLESVMGFREIAFRSLESDSPLVGAHVVQTETSPS